MRIADIRFRRTDWSTVEPTTHHGVSGTAFWRTQQFGALSACEWWSTRPIIWPITGVRRVISCCAWKVSWKSNLKTAEHLFLRPALAIKLLIKRNPIDHQHGSERSSSLLTSAASDNRSVGLRVARQGGSR
jgi:hypothetical protein